MGGGVIPDTHYRVDTLLQRENSAGEAVSDTVDNAAGNPAGGGVRSPLASAGAEPNTGSGSGPGSLVSPTGQAAATLAALENLARSPPDSLAEVEVEIPPGCIRLLQQQQQQQQSQLLQQQQLSSSSKQSSTRASLQPPSSRHSFAEASSDCLGRGSGASGGGVAAMLTMALLPTEAAGANRSASVPNIPATAVTRPSGEVEGCRVVEVLSVPGLPLDQRRASTKSTSQSQSFKPFGSAAAQAVQVVVNAGRRLSAMSGSRRTSDVSSGRSAGPLPVQRELLHCALQRLPMRDFGAEVRATMDVDQFLIQAVLLLDVQETSLEGIVDRMLHKVSTIKMFILLVMRVFFVLASF